jgi:hypothetical protein
MDKKLNILNYYGFLTGAGRKSPLEHGCEYFTFKTCLDLSQPIEVIPYGISEVYSIQDYSRDIASFISWWTHFVQPDLNEFSGFHNVKFVLVGFKLEL